MAPVDPGAVAAGGRGRSSAWDEEPDLVLDATEPGTPLSTARGDAVLALAGEVAELGRVRTQHGLPLPVVEVSGDSSAEVADVFATRGVRVRTEPGAGATAVRVDWVGASPAVPREMFPVELFWRATPRSKGLLEHPGHPVSLDFAPRAADLTLFQVVELDSLIADLAVSVERRRAAGLLSPVLLVTGSHAQLVADAMWKKEILRRSDLYPLVVGDGGRADGADVFVDWAVAPVTDVRMPGARRGVAPVLSLHDFGTMRTAELVTLAEELSAVGASRPGGRPAVEVTGARARGVVDALREAGVEAVVVRGGRAVFTDVHVVQDARADVGSTRARAGLAESVGLGVTRSDEDVPDDPMSEPTSPNSLFDFDMGSPPAGLDGPVLVQDGPVLEPASPNSLFDFDMGSPPAGLDGPVLVQDGPVLEPASPNSLFDFDMGSPLDFDMGSPLTGLDGPVLEPASPNSLFDFDMGSPPAEPDDSTETGGARPDDGEDRVGRSTRAIEVPEALGTRSEGEPGTGIAEPAPREVKPLREQLVPPSERETAALLEVVPPGTRFTDPARWVGLVNGDRSALGRDVNCLDAALAFHATYHGSPRVAGAMVTGRAPRVADAVLDRSLPHAPEVLGAGPRALGEVIDRVARGGHGSAALVFAYPPGSRDGHAWNVVNHDGVVSLVDAQAGTIRPATDDAIRDVGRLTAIPLGPGGEFLTGAPLTPPRAPDGVGAEVLREYGDRVGSGDWADYLDGLDDRIGSLRDQVRAAGASNSAAEQALLSALVLHQRRVDGHRMLADVVAGVATAVRGTAARLVPGIGGLRLVGEVVTAELAAGLAALLGRDVVALVVGSDAEEPREWEFPPRGRPLPVRR
ncbi:hypothetical protein CKY47_35355 [Saccharothrix yanglingensis]|uniref:Tox-PL domain-containing protein n=1 Tax=Saccharothrix yanglingensis TaxID=659496 RepID=A0ABU0XAF9_9PSEU|nr:hypothetical protein [Saccharothrix yanglingensis]